MKRKTNKSDVGEIVFDAPKAVGTDILQTIGHIVILWNAIETHLDVALVYGTRMPGELWTSVRSRLSGLEAKTDILKECLTPVMKFDPTQRALLADTLADFMILKIYRDSLIHVRLIMAGPKKMIAFASEKRGARYEILFSKPLINGILSRFRIFRREMHALNTLISMRGLYLSADGAKGAFGFEPDEVRALIEKITQADWKSLRENRKKRQSLRPLPEFPVEDPTALTKEERLQSAMRRYAEHRSKVRK